MATGTTAGKSASAALTQGAAIGMGTAKECPAGSGTLGAFSEVLQANTATVGGVREGQGGAVTRQRDGGARGDRGRKDQQAKDAISAMSAMSATVLTAMLPKVAVPVVATGHQAVVQAVGAAAGSDAGRAAAGSDAGGAAWTPDGGVGLGSAMLAGASGATGVRGVAAAGSAWSGGTTETRDGAGAEAVGVVEGSASRLEAAGAEPAVAAGLGSASFAAALEALGAGAVGQDGAKRVETSPAQSGQATEAAQPVDDGAAAAAVAVRTSVAEVRLASGADASSAGARMLDEAGGTRESAGAGESKAPPQGSGTKDGARAKDVAGKSAAMVEKASAGKSAAETSGSGVEEKSTAGIALATVKTGERAAADAQSASAGKAVEALRGEGGVPRSEAARAMSGKSDGESGEKGGSGRGTPKGIADDGAAGQGVGQSIAVQAAMGQFGAAMQGSAPEPAGLMSLGATAVQGGTMARGGETARTGEDGAGRGLGVLGEAEGLAGAGTVAAGHGMSELAVSRLLQTAAGSELRVGTRLEGLGAVSIRTVLGRADVQTHIAVESERLGSALTAHLGGLEESLSGKTGQAVRATVSVGMEMHAGGGQGQRGQGDGRTAAGQGGGQGASGGRQGGTGSGTGTETGSRAGSWRTTGRQAGGVEAAIGYGGESGVAGVRSRLDVRV